MEVHRVLPFPSTKLMLPLYEGELVVVATLMTVAEKVRGVPYWVLPIGDTWKPRCSVYNPACIQGHLSCPTVSGLAVMCRLRRGHRLCVSASIQLCSTGNEHMRLHLQGVLRALGSCQAP